MLQARVSMPPNPCSFCCTKLKPSVCVEPDGPSPIATRSGWVDQSASYRAHRTPNAWGSAFSPLLTILPPEFLLSPIITQARHGVCLHSSLPGPACIVVMGGHSAFHTWSQVNWNPHLTCLGCGNGCDEAHKAEAFGFQELFNIGVLISSFDWNVSELWVGWEYFGLFIWNLQKMRQRWK